jgi:hypothetical protein
LDLLCISRTDAEIGKLLHDSPWAQMSGPGAARSRSTRIAADCLEKEGANKLVLAIAYKNGRQKDKMEGHFPPVPSDPFLRPVYPLAATGQDKGKLEI